MSVTRLVIVDGVRTPFSKMGTDLAHLGADELGRIAVSALLAKTGLDPAIVDEVIFGCVAQPADAANVARVIALRAGIPEHVPAITVHRNCASGCEAITQAHEKMLAGRGLLYPYFGLTSPWLLDVAAVAFIVYAAIVALAARPAVISRATLMTVVAANMGYVVASMVLLVAFWTELPAVGRFLIVAVALAVEMFATLQFVAARRSAPASTQLA